MDTGTREDKLRAAITYIAQRTAPGKVQLFKLLYLADFTSYERFGEPITGECYEHFGGGPVPKTLWRKYAEITRSCVEITRVSLGLRFPKQEMRPKPGVDMSVLTASDIDVLDETVREYGHLSGTELRRLTHREIPYRLTQRGEVIPYYLAAYRHFKKPSDNEVVTVMADLDFQSKLRAALAG